MGVLTDIVIADHSEGQQLAEHSVPSKTWEGIDAKGIDPVKLGTLVAILSKVEYQDEIIDEFELLASGSDDEGPWVMTTPSSLVDLLTSAADLDSVAERWAQTEEFQLDQWSVSQVRETLGELAQLAVKAQEKGKPLIMWMSL